MFLLAHSLQSIISIISFAIYNIRIAFMMSKRVVILAGGKGTRLQPYTVVFPKPLMPVGDQPILEVVIKQLAYYGFEHITLAVNHQAELIQTFFGDGSKWNVRIDYSLEDRPLGTMGPLRIIEDLPKHFLVMNGDILTDLNFSDFYERHVSENDLFTISSYRREQNVDYGVLEIDDKKLVNFSEKPTKYYHVSMGIYMVSHEALNYFPESGTSYGFDDLMDTFIKKERTVRVVPHGGYWLDIGRPDDYIRAVDEFEGKKGQLIGG